MTVSIPLALLAAMLFALAGWLFELAGWAWDVRWPTRERLARITAQRG
jgi:high-affinity Fe2+/Pb2+ permease